MVDFDKYQVLTFDCYGTLIDWETGISRIVSPWLEEMGENVPLDLILSAFALHQAKHQAVRPTLLYTELLRRVWVDIEGSFGWKPNTERAEAFAYGAGEWGPFEDTVESLRYLSKFYKLAILSNVDNPTLKRTLVKLEVPFEFTVTAEDVNCYKPGHPHFERALELLSERGIDKSAVLHVAQSKHHDIKPGQELGLSTVWVNRRFGKKGTGATLSTEAEPDLAVNTMAELVAHHKARGSASVAG